MTTNEIEVSEPAQFQEIGYLCHTKDPAGYSIKLLQHTFEKNYKAKSIENIMDEEKYALQCDKLR